MLHNALKRQTAALIAPQGVVARIDLEAIAHNVRHFLSSTDAQLMAVVPADGFGHGAARVAHAALGAGATALGVATIAEARTLRRQDICAPILVWYYGPDDDIGYAIAENIHLSVPSLAHLAAITHAAHAVPSMSDGARSSMAHVHLEIDTGVHMGGCDQRDWRVLVEAARLAERRGILRVTGVWSRPLEPNHPEVSHQIDALKAAVNTARAAGLRPKNIHLANTALTLNGPYLGFNLVRVGLGIYGVDPTEAPGGTTEGLRPALSVTAPIVGIHMGVVHRDHTDVTGVDASTRESTLAVVPMGYADGIPANAANRAHVYVGGNPAPIVGRMGMDQMVVDVGQRSVTVGDDVAILGDGVRAPSVLDWSRWCDVAPAQILAGIGNGPRTLRWYWKSREVTATSRNVEGAM